MHSGCMRVPIIDNAERHAKRDAEVALRGSGRVPHISTGAFVETGEAQAKASIAAALIVRGVVEVPAIPRPGELPDEAGVRLRELTDYIYGLVTMRIPQP